MDWFVLQTETTMGVIEAAQYHVKIVSNGVAAVDERLFETLAVSLQMVDSLFRMAHMLPQDRVQRRCYAMSLLGNNRQLFRTSPVGLLR